MFVDTGIAIAVLDVDDPRHRPAVSRLAREPDPRILSSTWGEVMVAAYAKGERQIRLATEILDTAFDRVDLDREVVETAARLRGRLLRKGVASSRLPMLDAMVVAAAVVHDDKAMTTDRTWPLAELRVKQRVVIV
ncbi:MAG: PIN domain-containing protein [Actinobacteria bacterium]|nr:type II toxin-antitoxin system VapC family toxin [Actinomycetota bacterium]NIX53407.1 PIN domain-containing protein [Actinomycetota bacterium]